MAYSCFHMWKHNQSPTHKRHSEPVRVVYRFHSNGFPDLAVFRDAFSHFFAENGRDNVGLDTNVTKNRLNMFPEIPVTFFLNISKKF